MVSKITQLFTSILGANWRTSASGLLTLICVITAYVIHGDPELIKFLPEAFQIYILGIIKILAAVGAVLFIILVKDAQVTGGNVPQTIEAEHRIHTLKIGQKKIKK